MKLTSNLRATANRGGENVRVQRATAAQRSGEAGGSSSRPDRANHSSARGSGAAGVRAVCIPEDANVRGVVVECVKLSQARVLSVADHPDGVRSDGRRGRRGRRWRRRGRRWRRRLRRRWRPAAEEARAKRSGTYNPAHANLGVARAAAVGGIGGALGERVLVVDRYGAVELGAKRGPDGSLRSAGAIAQDEVADERGSHDAPPRNEPDSLDSLDSPINTKSGFNIHSRVLLFQQET